jgi:hypothetical protein
MYKLFLGVAASIILMSSSALAGDVGRYQAVPLGDLLFIIDTQEGYLWTCGVMKEEESVKGYITYQGQIGSDIQAEVPAEGLEASKAGAGRAVVKVMDDKGEVVRVIDQSMVKPSGWATSPLETAPGGDNQ